VYNGPKVDVGHAKETELKPKQKGKALLTLLACSGYLISGTIDFKSNGLSRPKHEGERGTLLWVWA
jgi:hypothetical protein